MATDDYVLDRDGKTWHPVTPDEHGNRYVTFGDGTYAVHTDAGWFISVEADDDDAS